MQLTLPVMQSSMSSTGHLKLEVSYPLNLMMKIASLHIYLKQSLQDIKAGVGVTVAKVDADAQTTIFDVVVLPGPDALIAPDWIPYRDRIQPGDVGVGDIVPSSLDDTRLVTGAEALPADEDLDTAMAIELGFGRARVMSIEGRDQAAKRWYEGDRGPKSPMAESAPKPCHSCGFFIQIAGSLRSTFGVCANAISPEDARVVSVDHGCGAHSEATFTAPLLN
jgi:hypothetical protein